MIWLKRAEMSKNPKKSDGVVHLVDMDLDLKMNEVTPNFPLQDGEKLTLHKLPENDRTRGIDQKKGDGAELHFKDKFSS